MKHKAIFVVFLIFICTSLRSQGIPAEGRDFYLGYLTPSFNRVVPEHTKKFFGIFAIVSAYQDTKVFVSYFDSVSGKESLPTEHFVKAKQTVEIPLDTNRMRMKDPGDQYVEYRSVHITSEHPISVMYYSQGACTGGEYLALSTSALGRNYVVGSYNDNPDGDLAMLGGGGAQQLDIACGYFLVIAVHDSTKITVTTTSTTQGGKHPGVVSGPGSTGVPQPYVVKLQRGQCYLVKSHCGSSDNDISGSIVQSDKPVAVISGHENMGYGSVGSRSVEGRDYVIEQMIPAEYGANTGFVSIPMVDSDPYNADATGENYRTSTFSENGAGISMWMAGISGDIGMSIGGYNVRDKFEAETPVDFSHNGSGGPSNNFNVFQFDIANHSAKAPFPRPSMMTVVPIKNWRTSYLVRGSTRSDNIIVKNYINVIGPRYSGLFDSIQVSKNGDPYVYLRNAGLAVVKVYQNIPNHPELMGKTYSVDTATYHLHASFPFMVYNFGHRAFSVTGVLAGTNHEKYTSFAAPSGYLGALPAASSLKVSYDTACAFWDLRITDTVAGSRIRAVMLMDDPTTDIIKPPIGEEAYISTNCSFAINGSTQSSRERGLTWNDSSITVTLIKDDPMQPSEAYLYVVSSSGGKIIHLENRMNYPIANISGGRDPIDISSTTYGLQVDSAVTFKNASTTDTYMISHVSLQSPDTNITILSTSKPMPYALKPGDSLTVRFKIRIRERGTHTNYINLMNDCVVARQALWYSYKTGLINVGDAEFGKVAVGRSKCNDKIYVTNSGESPFVLNDSVTFSNTRFRLSDESRKRLPLTLDPSDTAFFTVCFTPFADGADSASLTWRTDIASPYGSTFKTVSRLRGTGFATKISWDKDTLLYSIKPTDWETRRVYLRNSGDDTVVINKVYIAGQHTSEFIIAATELGMPPTMLHLPPHDSIYVDISFLEVKVYDQQIVRTAQLIAEIESDLIIQIDMTGRVGMGNTSVKPLLEATNFLITPNPVTGTLLSVSFSLLEEKTLSFAVYDVLGREILSVPPSHYIKGMQRVTLAASLLTEGGYILRVSNRVSSKSISFRVHK
jgi:hypothetical protein